MAQLSVMGNTNPLPSSAIAKLSAPRQTTGNSVTARVIRRLIGQPEHSYILQEAPRQYIRSLREAGVSGSYRRGLEASGSRDAVTQQHIASMQTLLEGLRGTSADEDGGFILTRLDSLLREHSQYLRSEEYEGLSWLSGNAPEAAPAEQAGKSAAPGEIEAPEREQPGFSREAAPPGQAAPAEAEPEREALPARETPAQLTLPQPQVQGDMVASSGLR